MNDLLVIVEFILKRDVLLSCLLSLTHAYEVDLLELRQLG